MSDSTKPINNLSWISDLLLKRARPIGHVLFWLVVLFFYTLYFGSRRDSYGQSLFFVGLLLPITVATTYFLLYWLIPRYLLKQRYFLFFLYFLYTLVFSVYLELMLVLQLYINVSDYQAMFVKPGIVDLLDVIISMYLVVFLAVAINLLKRWLSVQSTHAALEAAHLETALKLKETELQLLKSQIHPHFLFNTLNNLYALALEQSDHVPDMVLRISEQLDYVLYQGAKKRVSLDSELYHIQNYLALEAMRYDENRASVSLNVTGDPKHHFIAPLLLIPFVENSFKHGISLSQDSGWIKINVAVNAHQLSFQVANSRGINDRAAKVDHPVEEKPAGIGLSNVRRRLELLYPNTHTLDIEQADSHYKVNLTLQLNESA